MSGRCAILLVLSFLWFPLFGSCSPSASGPNRPPVADAGQDLHVLKDRRVLLDGVDSFDPDGDKLVSYDWRLVAAPSGAQAFVQPGTAVGLQEWQAVITPDVSGVWMVALVVGDGKAASEPDIVRLIAAQDSCGSDVDCTNDGLYCNGEEHCLDGICTFVDTQCQDSDPCTQDLCNEELDQCEFPPVGEPPGTEGPVGDPSCTDTLDNDCDGLTDLLDPTCIECTQDHECEDSNDCTTDTCNQGMCTNQQVADNELCDDGDSCTQDDRCAGGVCIGQLMDCSHLDGPCSAGVCDQGTGSCQVQAVNTGQACEDGLYCTMESECQAGQCVGTQDRTCLTSNEECQVGVCNDDSDQCEVDNLPDDTPCTTEEPCSTGATCQEGVCEEGQVCPLGCNTGEDPARCYQIDPSNLDPDLLCLPGAPDLVLPAGTVVFNTSDGTIGGTAVPNFQRVEQDEPGAPDIGVFAFTSLTIPSQTTVLVEGLDAFAIVACSDVDIQGMIDASAWQNDPGPGGYRGGSGNNDVISPATPGDGFDGGGGGEGAIEAENPYCHTPGGGAGFGRSGGHGGASDPSPGTPRPGGTAGSENGNESLAPLVGGSGGGGGAGRALGANGGGGGGAVQITAGGTVTVGPEGGIRVSGAGGRVTQDNYYGGGAGGGAGGSILIEGVTVNVKGKLTANGGGGGGGRTDYSGWNQWCPQNTPTPGEDGPYEDRRASGGTPCNANNGAPEAGGGGRGGAGVDDDLSGEAGGVGWIGGGGGGAAGRIRINSYDGQTDLSGGEISPHCTGTLHRCTLGDVSLW